ncbi:MAG: hypothetical protein WCL02_01680 [bacterium]
MKNKLFLIMVIILPFIISCGPSAEEKANRMGASLPKTSYNRDALDTNSGIYVISTDIIINPSQMTLSKSELTYVINLLKNFQKKFKVKINSYNSIDVVNDEWEHHLSLVVYFDSPAPVIDIQKLFKQNDTLRSLITDVSASNRLLRKELRKIRKTLREEKK